MILLLLLACLPDPAPASQGCTSCHGSPETGPAPPEALGGLTDPSAMGVGAHAGHHDVACTECHLVPGSTDAEGHVDTPWPAEVKWGDLAKTGGATVAWDRTTATCTVYCHGATWGAVSPGWTTPAPLGCGGCHGNPPPPPHVSAGACGGCHPDPGGATHLDGVVDTLGCAGCHGEGDSLAPPPDTSGSSDTSRRGVGAHAAHADVPCTSCHVVPAAVDDPGHLDGGNAEVVLSGVAAAGGVTPSYDDVALTCVTWCHGVTLSGATDPVPVWTVVDGTYAACGACHGNPPPSPHPDETGCRGCHSGAHVDGAVGL